MTGVQTCALPICEGAARAPRPRASSHAIRGRRRERAGTGADRDVDEVVVLLWVMERSAVVEVESAVRDGSHFVSVGPRRWSGSREHRKLCKAVRRSEPSQKTSREERTVLPPRTLSLFPQLHVFAADSAHSQRSRFAPRSRDASVDRFEARFIFRRGGVNTATRAALNKGMETHADDARTEGRYEASRLRVAQ